MAYTPTNWQPGSAGGTPITAAALNNIESGVAAAQNPAAWTDMPAPVMRRPIKTFATASTTYGKNDIVDYEGRPVILRQGVTIAAGTAKPWISATNYVSLGVPGVWDATSWGIQGGDEAKAASNTAGLADLFTQMKPYGGGVVMFPAGYYFFAANSAGTAAIDVPPNTVLIGQGIRSTWLTLASGANVPLVKAHTSTGSGDANSSLVGIQHMTLDGNRTKQTVAKPVVEFNTNPRNATQASTSEPFDMRHHMFRVEVRNGSGDGIYHDGRSGIHYQDVWVQYCLGYGFNVAFDTILVGCEAEKNGQSGFHFRSGQAQAIGCKSFLNGYDYATSTYKTTGSIHGFHADHDAAGGTVNITGCNAQNNAGAGLRVTGGQCNVNATDFIADTNAAGAVASGSNTMFAAVELEGAKRCIISGTSTQGDQAGASLLGRQVHSVKLWNSADQNVVTMSHFSRSSSTLQVGAVVHPDSVTTGNRIIGNATQLAP